MSQQVKIKKVKPYPILASIKCANGAVFPGKILKMNLQGFLIETPPTQLQPGDRFDCTFELPASRQLISQHCKMIKLYSHWRGLDGGGSLENPEKAPASKTATGSVQFAGLTVNHLVEIHFESLTEVNKRKIREFLNSTVKNSP